MPRAAYLLLGAATIAAPAHARSASVDVPAGTAGQAAVAIARQTGTSIVITDIALSRRHVPAIKGDISAAEAVARLARAAGAEAIPAGAMGWRLVPARVVRADRRAQKQAVQGIQPRPEPQPVIPDNGIVVTGSKRDIPLADYPGQVEMIDGGDLTLGGAGGTDKITDRIPTVSSTHLGSGRNKLFIRGIADSSFTGPTQSTVGQYFGDLRLSYNAPDPDLRLSDLERVEILEGPQGTLYGAGALGGIVRMVPNPPAIGEVSGSGTVGVSATEHGAMGGDASLTANLPLIGDVAAIRFNVDAETRGGYIDKPLLDEKNVNRTNILGGRAAARFAIGSDWVIDLVGLGQTTHGDDSQYADRDGPPLTRAALVGEGFDADYAQGQFVVSGDIGAVRISSSSGITGQNLQERYDATEPGGPLRVFVQSNHTRMFANETRLWRPLQDVFGWVLGVSYVRNRTTLSRELGPPDAPAATTGVRNSVDEVTVYGEASLRLAEGLTASVGGRYTYSWLGGAGEDVSPQLAIDLAAITAERSEKAFLPSASLAANVLADTTLYVRYQEGFRPGGLAISGDFVTRFRSDHIATMELGARHGRTGAGPFEIAASVAFTRWDNIQADYIDSAGLPSTANIGDGHIWSANVTGSVAIGGDWRIEGGVTYNSSKVDEPVKSLIFARTSQVPNIAHIAARVGFDYQHDFDDELVLNAQGWAHYVGRSRLGVGPELGEEQGDYLDSGLNVRLGRKNIGVTLSLTNLTDEQGNRFALGTPFAIGRDQITPLRPRTIRLGIDANF